MSSREKNGRKHNHPARNHAGRNHREGAQAATINKPLPKLTSNQLRILLVSALLAVAAGIWAYWDSFLYLWKVWESDPDYSHGYLVAPLAVYFLYLRRKSFPGVRPYCWWGLLIILLALGVRMLGDLAYVEPLNAWSMVIWIAGVAYFFLGTRAFRWSAPAIAFLFFMLPLPYRVERLLSVPLQSIATKASTWTLQTLGEPAIAEGNKIRIGEEEFGVEEACSGLRIFVSILAVGFAYLILIKRPWWERCLLIASVLPVALVANITRVVVTCLFYGHASGDFADQFSHDFAGYVMIPYAALLFAFVLWYLRVLFPEVQQLDVRSALKHG